MRSLAETGNCDQYSWSEGADQPIPTDSLFLTASNILSKLCFENKLGTGKERITPKWIFFICTVLNGNRNWLLYITTEEYSSFFWVNSKI